MIVGLLKCDHVDARFRGIAGDYGEMFGALLGGRATLKGYDVVNGVLPQSPDACDAWLITGSRRSVYDDEPWIEALAAFVVDLYAAAAPCVGVCFGHQMIGHALGGRVVRADGGWGVGNHPASIDRVEPWMGAAVSSSSSSSSSSYELLYMHQDQVVELPPGGVALAHTDHCPVALLQVGPRMLGVQGHPEFPAAYVRALLEDRVERVGAAKTGAALASLERTPDRPLIADWIVGFLGR